MKQRQNEDTEFWESTCVCGHAWSKHKDNAEADWYCSNADCDCGAYHPCQAETEEKAMSATPPNEIDELTAIVDNFARYVWGLSGHNFEKATHHQYKSGRDVWIPLLQDYITKQNQAYHAAGLRELKQHEFTDSWGLPAIYTSHIDEMIAKEESK